MASTRIVIPPRIRADELYAERLAAGHRRVNGIFKTLLPLQWIGAILFAVWVSPYTWAGDVASIHAHLWAAVILGGLIVALPLWLIRRHPGAEVTRQAVGLAQMAMGMLWIHLSGGRIETHFHIFGSLAFLALYRDTKVLVTASAAVAADHLLRGAYWPRSVYGVATAASWRWLEHSAWVVYEDLVLARGCRQSLAELRDLAERQAEAESAHAMIDRVVRLRTDELERANAALSIEVADRRRAEQEALARRQFIEGLAQANPSILYLIDLAANRTVWINGRLGSVLGYTPEVTCGRGLDRVMADLLHPDDATRLGFWDYPRGSPMSATARSWRRSCASATTTGPGAGCIAARSSSDVMRMDGPPRSSAPPRTSPSASRPTTASVPCSSNRPTPRFSSMRRPVSWIATTRHSACLARRIAPGSSAGTRPS